MFIPQQHGAKGAEGGEMTAKQILNAEYRAAHREELNRKQRERYANDPEYRAYQREYFKRWWKENGRAT